MHSNALVAYNDRSPISNGSKRLRASQIVDHDETLTVKHALDCQNSRESPVHPSSDTKLSIQNALAWL
eukprot:scaffold2707_cov417-Prasinococcus_capsulatus_cf.AAC.36